MSRAPRYRDLLRRGRSGNQHQRILAARREQQYRADSRSTTITKPTSTTVRTLGNHLIQFGFQLRKDQFDDLNPTVDVNGSYTFDGEITNGKNSAGDAINALADFLLGDIKTGSYSLAQPLIGRRNYNVGLYIQDDWKLSPKLTLNLGLRWEYESPLTRRQ